MRDKLIRFMYGRNGADQYSRFLTVTGVVLIILRWIVGLLPEESGNLGAALGAVLYYAAVVLLVYSVFRMFSKNLTKRRAENAKFLKLRSSFRNELRNKRERASQRRDYKFFRCPSCRAMLRLPRGKGKIRVTCRKCGTAFERKT